MHPSRAFMVLLPMLAVLPLHAQDLATTCGATSSYDVTLRADSLLFDRAAPAPTQVQLQDGALRTNGVPVGLGPEDQDRLALFERGVRALEPQVKTVALHGVDLAMRAMHDEAASMGLSTETRAELDSRLAAHAAELRQRIGASHSTHDWQGPVIQQYANQVAGEITPLLAGDLGQQALNAAMNGNLQAAADLRDRAADLASGLQPRLQQRMQALRPQIQALCPAIRRLAELQQGVRGSNGLPLNLLQVGGP